MLLNKLEKSQNGQKNFIRFKLLCGYFPQFIELWIVYDMLYWTVN